MSQQENEDYSSIFQRVLDELKYNKERREAGKDICIPWLGFPKLSKVIPGVQRGRYVIVTANSKVGKTQIADTLFLYEPLEYIWTKKNDPNNDIKLKIFYFCLEMSKEDKIAQMVCNKIYKDHKIITSTETIRSYFQDGILSNELLAIIEGYRDYFKWVNEHVEFIDHIRNPFGIYKEMRKWAQQNGKFYLDGVEALPGERYDTYVPDDPFLYTIVITDHVSLLTPERGEELWDAMFKFSSEYCLKMRDNFKFTVVNIQQQAGDQEKQQYTFKGESIVDKLRPSQDGLGDCKLTQRDCDLMFGLFAPHRYKIKKYEGYDITRFGEHYRELSIVLNRRGRGSLNLDLLFHGAANVFKELPSPQELDRISKAYELANKWNQKD